MLQLVVFTVGRKRDSIPAGSIYCIMRRERDIAAAYSIHSEKEKGQLIVFIVRRKRDIAAACTVVFTERRKRDSVPAGSIYSEN